MLFRRKALVHGFLLTLSLLVVTNLHITPTIAQTCPPDGEVNEDGIITPQDALLVFQHFLGIASPPLTECQQGRANVFMPASTSITFQDARCILQRFLNLPSCFPSQPEIPDGTEIQFIVSTPHPLTIRLINAAGQPVAETQVAFRITAGDGSLSRATVMTDPNGSATTILNVGATPGLNRIEAQIIGLEPVVFTITGVVTQDVGRTVEVRGNTQPAPPGTVIEGSFVVRMEDAFGNPVAGVEVTARVRGDGAEITTLLATSAQLGGNTLLQAQTGDVTTAIAITDAQGEARFLVQGTVGTEDITAAVSVLGQEITVPIVSNGTLLPNPNNIEPVVASPQAQTAIEGQAVELQLTASDTNRDALTFSATNLPLGLSLGPSTGRISGTIDRTASQGSPYTVTITVSDGTATATVSFPWTITNPPPVANAGADQVASVGATITLNGTASHDPDGDTLLSFRWAFTSLPAGSAATLSDPATAQPTFVVDRPGTYVAQLIVNDGTADSTPGNVSITASNPPVANAGDDQVVSLGVTVTLNGTASQDPDGDTPLSFRWTFTSLPAGSAATLSDSTTAQPTFVVDRPGTYIVELIVNDGLIDSDPDTVIITTFSLLVSSANSNSVLRYNGQTGVFHDAIVPDRSGGLRFPRGPGLWARWPPLRP